jgi:hypothetical protein
MAFADLDEQALKKANPISRSNRDTELFRRVRALLNCTDEIATDDSEATNPCAINTDATVV